MKETFIVCNLNELEFNRTLAKYQINTLGLRLFNAEKLAKEVLLRNGVVLNKIEINDLEQICIIKSLMINNNYFSNSTFVDAKNLTNALNRARKLCAGNESELLENVFADGEFTQKNNAILDVYKCYMKYLNDNDLIDSIGIINKVINDGLRIDADFITFEEFELEPLEHKLINNISSNVKKLSINEYFNFDKNDVSNVTYASAYGKVNEIEYILDYIASKKLTYEDCLIVPLDKSYINEFVNYQNLYNIPISYKTGLPISSSKAAQLLNLFNKWESNFYSVDELRNIFEASVFDVSKFWSNIGFVLSERQIDEVINTVGSLRISTQLNNDLLNNYRSTIKDEKQDIIYQTVECIAKQFNKGYTYLLSEYCFADTAFEIRALNKICNYLLEYEKYNNTYKLEDIIDDILNINIQTELSSPKYLHITNLSSAFASIRKHIFICGLNATYFPGTPSEDYLLLDSDLERFNLDKQVSSSSLINDRKKLLLDFVKFASNAKSSVHLSFTDYNLADLKLENPSSMAFEIYKLENGDDASIEDFNKVIDNKYRFFSSNISTLRNVGNKYIEGCNLKEKEIKLDEYTKVVLDRAISPSGADQFFACEKRFYLNYVLGIKEPQDNDPFDLLPANDEGTLIHECMQDYGNNPNWTKEEFMTNASSKLSDYFKKHIPLYDKNISKITKDFLVEAENGFDNDPHNEVVCSEYYFKPLLHDESGLVFKGIVDRIEKLKNGNYLIVDYKTYRDIKNKDNDVESCLQVLIYAYLYEKLTGHKVEACEYRYLKNVRTIKCVYDQDIKALLNKRLNKIKEALDSGVFNCTDDKDNCKYCKHMGICGVNKVFSTNNKEVE